MRYLNEPIQGETEQEIKDEVTTMLERKGLTIVKDTQTEITDVVLPACAATGGVFYSSIQYLQMSDDTNRLDKMDANGILQEAREYDNGDAIDMDKTYAKAVKYPGDTVIAEDDHYAVVNNNQVGGTYDIMRKVSEKEVRDAINRYGLPSDATEDVKNVAKAMVAEEFSKMATNRMPIFEMNNGSVLYVQYSQEKDTMDVGTATNVGMSVLHQFPYDHDFNLDANLEGVNEKLTEMTVYQAEIDSEQETENVAEEQHYHRGR